METDGIWSSRVSDDFRPDGNLEKQVWIGARQVRFDRDPFQRVAYPEIATSVATVWTPKHLYLGYWCRFVCLHVYEADETAAERWELWHRDVVEAFITPSPVAACHYYEFEVAPNNQWLDLEIDLEDGTPRAKDWNSGFLHAVNVDQAQRIWTAEMRIPAEAMGVKEIDPDSIWRINFCRSDGPSSARRLLSWRSLDARHRSFHQPALFGVLRFG